MTPTGQWADPRVWITLAIMAIFTYAYANQPDDQAMKGALIAAFAAAYGYWIGASKGAATLNENLGKALDVASSAQPDKKPDVTLKPGETAQAEKTE